MAPEHAHPGPPAAAPDVAFALAPDAGAARRARAAVLPLADGPAEADDLGRLAAEIVTNAVRHGSRCPDAMILVSVLARADAFVLTASNEPRPPGGPPPEPGAGKGLAVLRALGADVRLRCDAERTVASCRLPRRGARRLGVAG